MQNKPPSKARRPLSGIKRRAPSVKPKTAKPASKSAVARKKKPASAKASAAARKPIAASGSRRPRLTVIHDADRDVRFATYGALPAEQRLAAVRRGLPARFLVEALETLQISRAELLDGLGIASSTAARAAQLSRPFPSADSERLAMLARLWGDVMMVYEDPAGARAWITKPIPSAGGVPLQLLQTHEGFEQAQRSILQLAYGVYA
jgi:putative toxin-antitoxin system antitoxin component (TIGR02293 family)